jgi:hypothetical protein
MSRLNINIGTTANDRTGDPLRTAFEKVNANFTELYNTVGADAPANKLVNGASEVVLDEGGMLTVPGSIAFQDGVITLNDNTDPGIVLGSSNKSVFVSTLSGIDQYKWKFGTDGKLNLPATGTINNLLSGVSSIALVLNNLGQTVSTIIADKTLLLNSSWGLVQVGWTITIGLVTRNVIGITEDVSNVNFELDGLLTLPNTGSITFQSLESKVLELTPDGTTTWTFGSDGTLTSPNGATQTSTGSINCQPGVDTVVFTSSQAGIQTIKLLLKVEGVVTGNDLDTQSCEMIIAKSFRGPTVVSSVYGIVYTSVAPLATFTADWNAVSSRVDVTCRPTSLTNNVTIKAFATEITTSD